jgi:hypothetical protein
MATGTSRLPAVCLAAGAALAAGGCGASGGAGHGAASSTQSPKALAAGDRTDPFTALRAGAAPASWGIARIGAGGALFYPPGWRLDRGDAGTATAILSEARGGILGYLNLTPRQGNETLSNWASFRVSHNVAEGERDVKLEQAAYGVRFRTGRGTCVRDSYTTASRARFIELACLVRGARATSVVVGAAPPRAWTATSPLLYRSIAAFIT